MVQKQAQKTTGQMRKKAKPAPSAASSTRNRGSAAAVVAKTESDAAAVTTAKGGAAAATNAEGGAAVVAEADGGASQRRRAGDVPAEELTLTFQAFAGQKEWLVSVPLLQRAGLATFYSVDKEDAGVQTRQGLIYPMNGLW